MLKKVAGFLIICVFILLAGLFFYTPQYSKDKLIMEQKTQEQKETLIEQHKNSISGFEVCDGSPISFIYSSDQPKIPNEIKSVIQTWDSCIGSYDFEFSGSYSGGWKSGKEHFYGVWSNGEDSYVGGFFNGLRHGFGRELNFGKIMREGFYEDGKLKDTW